jgi:hypothetical protein
MVRSGLEIMMPQNWRASEFDVEYLRGQECEEQE